MKTISMTMISICGLAGLAFAGDPKAGGAPPAKTMEMPKAPQEVADRVKAMAGTWKCDGTTQGMDGKSMPFKGSMTSKADLDGFWVHDSFAGTMGEGKMSMKFKFESYSTFDAAGKKWHTMFMDNTGGMMMGMADPIKDGKMESTGEMMSSMGKSQFKDHMDASDMKKGAHMWGEMSADNGKTWKPVYDMTCKK
jgi:uncharacterized protein DUF1579